MFFCLEGSDCLARTNIYSFCLKTGPADHDGLPGPQLEPTAPNSDQTSSETNGKDSGKL